MYIYIYVYVRGCIYTYICIYIYTRVYMHIIFRKDMDKRFLVVVMVGPLPKGLTYDPWPVVTYMAIFNGERRPLPWGLMVLASETGPVWKQFRFGASP